LTAVYASALFPPTPSIGTSRFVYTPLPPSSSELLANIGAYGIPTKVYRDPYYSKKLDASDKPREYAGLLYCLKGGNGIRVLQDWGSPSETFRAPRNYLNISHESIGSANISGWEYASCAPTVRESRRWLKSDAAKIALNSNRMSKRSQASLLAPGEASTC
jgi:DNA polymerase zeta